MIEVADSSLGLDRTTKLGIYAAAGIPQYVIVNLPERVVEVYTVPMNGKLRPDITLALVGALSGSCR